MIRRILLALTVAAMAGPVLAQPPAPAAPVAVTQRPDVQGVPVQTDQQGFGGRGGGRRNRGGFQGGGFNGDPNGAGGRRFGRLNGGPGGPGGPGAAPVQTPPAPVAASTALALAIQAAVGRPAGPPPIPGDAQVMRSLQGSISAVFDPGAKTARIKLIETDDHGVEGVRTLKAGDLYRDGWRLAAVTATEATLRKGKTVLHVDFSRGWPARAPIQPAVLVQPVTPPPIVAGGRRGPAFAPAAARGPATAANPALGLSNARTGGGLPAPPRRPSVLPNMTIQGPSGPTTIMTNPDGSRTITSIINGQTITATMAPPR